MVLRVSSTGGAMRNCGPRAMVIVLGVVLAGHAMASPVEDSIPETQTVTPLDVPDRPMPSIPPDDSLLEDGRDEGGGAAVRVPINNIPVVEYDPEKLPIPVRRLREQIIEAAAS